MSMKCGSPQATDAANNGSDSGSLTSAENSAQQGASSGSGRCVLDALAASTTCLDRAFHIDFLAGRCVIELNEFGVNRGAPAVGHNQSVKTKHHAGMTLDLAGHL